MEIKERVYGIRQEIYKKTQEIKGNQRKSVKFRSLSAGPLFHATSKIQAKLRNLDVRIQEFAPASNE